MAWDFSTDPEFQQKLDWMTEFVQTEVEGLDLGLHELRHPVELLLEFGIGREVPRHASSSPCHGRRHTVATLICCFPAAVSASVGVRITLRPTSSSRSVDAST